MDITDRFLELSQNVRVSSFDPYRNRFVPSHVPTTESHYISETTSVLFLLIDSAKILKELSSETSSHLNFSTHSNRLRSLSEKIENNIKISQLKLEEIQHIDIPNCCSNAIHEVLQKRLFLLTKDFQISLQARTKQLRESKDKKNGMNCDFEIVSKDKPTFLEEDNEEHQQQIEDLNYLQSRTQSVEQVEKQLSEVAEMIQKIAVLVHEQGSEIDRIDMNTEDSLKNIQTAKTEIEKYYSNVTNNRNLGIKVFMIFVIFFVFYVVFLV